MFRKVCWVHVFSFVFFNYPAWKIKLCTCPTSRYLTGSIYFHNEDRQIKGFFTTYRKWFACHFSSTLLWSLIKYRLKAPQPYKSVPYLCSSKYMLGTVVPLHQWSHWCGPSPTSALSSKTIRTMRNIDSDISMGYCIWNCVVLEDGVGMKVVLLFRYWNVVTLSRITWRLNR